MLATPVRPVFRGGNYLLVMNYTIALNVVNSFRATLATLCFGGLDILQQGLAMILPGLAPLARFDFLGAHKLTDVIRVKVGKPGGLVGSNYLTGVVLWQTIGLSRYRHRLLYPPGVKLNSN